MSVDSSPSDMSISDVLNVVSTDVTSSHFFEGFFSRTFPHNYSWVNTD